MLCYRASEYIYICVPSVCTGCMHKCGCASLHTRQSHRSHCCDPVPGAGRRSRAPLTGGSTISHSSTDGPVYSATQRHTANKQVIKKKRKDPTLRQADIILFDDDVTNWSLGKQRGLCLTQADAKKACRDQVN